MAEGTRTGVKTTSASLLWLLVMLVSRYHLLLDGARLRDWIIHLAPEPARLYDPKFASGNRISRF